MALDLSLKIENQIATIVLTGEINSATAPDFKSKIEEVAGINPLPQTLVLDMEKLEFMASAGVRVLVFTKQKMGKNVEVFILKPNEMVKDTLTKTGVHHSVKIVDSFDEVAAV